MRRGVQADPAPVALREPIFGGGAGDVVPALRPRGDLDGAEQWYGRALEAEPRSEDVLSNMGTLAERRGDLSSAEKFYRAALAASEFSYATKADLGLVLLRQGRTAEAREELEAAAPHLKSKAEVWGNLALARERTGDAAEAAEAFREMLALEPGNVRAREGLARVGGTP
jgi:Tfp pilus assembly protein PilF